MEELVALLREKGYKITPQRRAVIEALLGCGKFPTAQQVREFIKKTNPDISLDTIYRNLGLLIDLGVVHEINLHNREGNVFEIVTSGHHHHLVCIECGETECLEICPVNDTYIAEAEARGFTVTGHTFEFYGRCRHCKNNK